MRLLVLSTLTRSSISLSITNQEVTTSETRLSAANDPAEKTADNVSDVLKAELETSLALMSLLSKKDPEYTEVLVLYLKHITDCIAREAARDPPSQLSKFPKFEELPTELRRQVWNAAPDIPRVMPIMLHSKHDTAATVHAWLLALVPPLFYVNEESRVKASKANRLLKSSILKDLGIFFSLKIDIL
ncbi:hypothetical protein B0J14DRAFT_562966 [Halenospora varia]|nr:hypothetical protein B0J14DRAFT_562966 [Halenospora varia]